MTYLGILLFVLIAALPVKGAEIQVVAAELAPHAGLLLPQHGWVPRVLTLALKDRGFEPLIQFMPFPRALSWAQQGQVEAIAPLYKSAARAEYLLFSEPLGFSQTALFYQSKKPINFKGLDDLKGLKVAVMRGARVSDDFDDNGDLVRVEVTSYEQQVRMLMAGRVDAIVGEEFVVREMLRRQYSPGARGIVQAEQPLAVQAMYVGVAKNAKHAAAKLTAINLGLAQLRASGVYGAILAEYGIAYRNGYLLPIGALDTSEPHIDRREGEGEEM
jgi:polar amino acid transport system substrate-binding protein